jgi:hypothetical protein
MIGPVLAAAKRYRQTPQSGLRTIRLSWVLLANMTEKLWIAMGAFNSSKVARHSPWVFPVHPPKA